MATTWISVGMQLGYPTPGLIDTGNVPASGTGTAVTKIPIGTISQFRDIGSTQLGMGEFIWLPGVASTIVGSWCSFTTSDGTINTGSTTLWAGTASTPFPLAVATAAVILTTNWGWYQIGGAAICATNGTIAAGNAASWQAAGVVQAATVATKNVDSAIALSANGVPGTNQAIYFLERPASQSAV